MSDVESHSSQLSADSKVVRETWMVTRVSSELIRESCVRCGGSPGSVLRVDPIS